MNSPAPLRSAVVPEVRARLFGCPRAELPSRVVKLQPSARYFFSLMDGINPVAKVAVTGAFAREFFSVSNDPTRQNEREAIWADDGNRCRSLSVGDVVEVDFCDGQTWMAVCLPCGWSILLKDEELLAKLDAAPTLFDREDLVRSMKPATHAE